MSREIITIPRPHVPFGPTRVPENVADADYLRSAARGVEFHRLFGSNLTRVVAQLLRDAADAVAALSSDAAPQAAGVTREAVPFGMSGHCYDIDGGWAHDPGTCSAVECRHYACCGYPPVADAPAAPEGE